MRYFNQGHFLWLRNLYKGKYARAAALLTRLEGIPELKKLVKSLGQGKVKKPFSIERFIFCIFCMCLL